jgi:hypothetical protein
MFVHSRWHKTDIKSGIFKETIELRFQEWSRGRGISKNAVGDIWDIRHVPAHLHTESTDTANRSQESRVSSFGFMWLQ